MSEKLLQELIDENWVLKDLDIRKYWFKEKELGIILSER